LSGARPEIHQAATCCQCVVVIWLWMLLTGSEDELCGPLSAQYYPLTVGPSAFIIFVYWKLLERSALAPPPPLVHLEHSAPSAACSFLVPCLFRAFFFFCWVGGSVCPGGYAGLP
jgi:hypothetical protein